MITLISVNQWRQSTADLTGEKNIRAQLITANLTGLYKPDCQLSQKINFLIAIKEFSKDEGHEFKAINQDVTAILKTILHAQDDENLAQKISEKKAAAFRNPQYIPGLSALPFKADSTPFSRSKDLLIQLVQKEIKRETASEKLLRSMKNEFQRGANDALDNFLNQEPKPAIKNIEDMKKLLKTVGYKSNGDLTTIKVTFSSEETAYFDNMKKAYLEGGSKEIKKYVENYSNFLEKYRSRTLF